MKVLSIYDLRDYCYCPYLLFQNTNQEKNTPFSFCIHEILKWGTRRGKLIDYHILMKALSYYLFKHNILNDDNLIKFRQKVRHLLNSNIIDFKYNMIFNHEVEFLINSDFKLRYKIEIISYDNKKPTFFFFTKKPKNIFSDPKIFFTIAWSFIKLNGKPELIFISEGEDIQDTFQIQKYQTQEEDFYICKKIIADLKDRFANKIFIPKDILCINCERSNQCKIIR